MALVLPVVKNYNGNTIHNLHTFYTQYSVGVIKVNLQTSWSVQTHICS